MRRLLVSWSLAALALVVAAVAPGVASAVTYAPVDRPGPAFDVSQAALDASLSCSPGVDNAARAPVLLVPGTGATPVDNYSWNYEPQFKALGIPWCAVTLPQHANGDIQVAGEYVANAIRTLHRRAGRRIAIIGHSQGGMVPRWALRFWPDTRAMVDDMIGFAPTNHGTAVAGLACGSGCSAADWQQSNKSNFIKALNSYQETFPGISYTDVYTHFDEEVQPNSDSSGTSSLHGGGGQIANIAVQDVCPTDVVEHLGIGTYDNVAYNIAIDALDHPGPADPQRIPATVCLTPLMPGVSPITGPGAGLQALIDDETSPSTKLPAEPPLACYVMASCPAAVQPAKGVGGSRRRCSRPHGLFVRLPVPRHSRIVRAVVRVDGRVARRVHGRRLVRIGLPVLHAGRHRVRVLMTTSGGRRVVVTRRYLVCGLAKLA